MSDNLTIFGKNYTGVTGIKTKGTGNGTLTYIRPSGTKSISTNGTGIDVASYASVDVAVSSNLNVPTFTVTWDADYTTIQSITCDKTYISLSPNNYLDAHVEETNGTETYELAATCSELSNNYIQYTVINGSCMPKYDIVYNRNGTITSLDPSSRYKVLNATQNGTYYPSTGVFGEVNVVVPSSSPSLQAKTATPTESQQTVTADSGYDGLSSVEVGAISSTYVGSEITRRSSTDLTISGATVTVPSGYYSSDASTSITNGTLSNPTVTYINAGYWTGSIAVNNKVETSGYLISNTSKSETFRLNEVLPIQAAKTITPTESIQTAVDQYKWTTGVITVDAISSTYVGSEIDKNNSTNLTASGATVTVPAGYYAEQASKTIANGTEGTPTATKGTVSSHSISVTPSVTNSAGYITGGTKTGTAVSVSASELVSGTYTVSASGTHDVTNYASASVAAGSATAPASISGTSATVSTGTNTLTLSKTVSNTPQVTAGYISEGTAGDSSVSLTASVNTRSSNDLTASGATITAPAGYYADAATKSVSTMTLPTAASSTSSGTSKATIGRSTSNQYINIPTGYNNTASYYTVSAVANGSATGPSSLSGSSATISTGTNTITLTKTGVTTTPTVSAGYVSSATASTATVALTASVTTKAAATITPGTTNQTIASGTYLTGTQTIAGDANLVSSNIISGKSIFGVSGSVVLQTVYTGSSAPSSSTGSNGDIYIQA